MEFFLVWYYWSSGLCIKPTFDTPSSQALIKTVFCCNSKLVDLISNQFAGISNKYSKTEIVANKSVIGRGHCYRIKIFK